MGPNFKLLKRNDRTNYWKRGKVPIVWPCATDVVPNAVLKWYPSGTEDNYHKRGNKAFGPDDIEYRLNEHGYRADRLDPDSPNLKIMFLGCSFTFGTGLPLEQVWTKIITERISGA